MEFSATTQVCHHDLVCWSVSPPVRRSLRATRDVAVTSVHKPHLRPVGTRLGVDES